MPPPVVPPPAVPPVPPVPPVAAVPELVGLAPPVFEPLVPELVAAEPPEDELGTEDALEEPLAGVEELDGVVLVLAVVVVVLLAERFALAPPGTVSDPAGVVSADVEPPPPPQPASVAAKATHEAARAS